MFIDRQVYPAALKSHSLRFQQKPLLKCIFARQGDAASGAQYPLPRQARHLVQDLRNMPCASWIASSLGDRTVGTDPSAGNPANRRSYGHSKWKLGATRTLYRSR